MKQILQDHIMEEINFSGGIDKFVTGLHETVRNSHWEQWLKDGILISAVFYRSLYDLETVDIEYIARANVPKMIKLTEGLKEQKRKTESSIFLSELIDLTLSRIAVLRKVS